MSGLFLKTIEALVPHELLELVRQVASIDVVAIMWLRPMGVMVKAVCHGGYGREVVDTDGRVV